MAQHVQAPFSAATSIVDSAQRGRGRGRCRRSPWLRIARHLQLAGPDQRRASQARRVGRVGVRQRDVRRSVLGHQRRGAGRRRRCGAAARRQPGRRRTRARRPVAQLGRRPRAERPRQLLRHRRVPSPGAAGHDRLEPTVEVRAARLADAHPRHPAVGADRPVASRRHALAGRDPRRPDRRRRRHPGVGRHGRGDQPHARRRRPHRVRPGTPDARRAGRCVLELQPRCRPADAPNFAIVPIGQGGSISVYSNTGGNAIIDVLGYFTAAAGGRRPTAGSSVSTRRSACSTRAATAAASRWRPTARSTSACRSAFRRTRSRRSSSTSPARRRSARASCRPTRRQQRRHLQDVDAQPHRLGARRPTRSSCRSPSTGVSLFADLGPGGSAHVIADVTGYITSAAAASSSTGLFVPVAPARAYDSRNVGADDRRRRPTRRLGQQRTRRVRPARRLGSRVELHRDRNHPLRLLEGVGDRQRRAADVGA